MIGVFWKKESRSIEWYHMLLLKLCLHIYSLWFEPRIGTWETRSVVYACFLILIFSESFGLSDRVVQYAILRRRKESCLNFLLTRSNEYLSLVRSFVFQITSRRISRSRAHFLVIVLPFRPTSDKHYGTVNSSNLISSPAKTSCLIFL